MTADRTLISEDRRSYSYRWKRWYIDFLQDFKQIPRKLVTVGSGWSLKKKKKHSLDFLSSCSMRKSSILEDRPCPVGHSFQNATTEKYFPNRKPAHEITFLKLNNGKTHRYRSLTFVDRKLSHLLKYHLWTPEICHLILIFITTGKISKVLISHWVSNSRSDLSWNCTLSNSKARRKSITRSVCI